MFLPLHRSLNQEVSYQPEDYPAYRITIKRDDLLHPHISGNKYRKLKYNLEQAYREGKHTLLTFGGAYSNHIVATAVAGFENGFKTIGVIRGDELGRNYPQSVEENPSLSFAARMGMRFYFVDRTTYRNKESGAFLEHLKEKFGDFYPVPQGGTNALAVKGTQEIISEQDKDFHYICSAIGTGGTIAGIINAAYQGQEVIGFPALKGDFLARDISRYVHADTPWSLKEYHFGGFAKINDELVEFINDFKDQTNIQLDPVYTGKMMYGIIDMFKKGEIPPDAKVLAIHTGGLQGIRGMNLMLKKKGKKLLNF